MIRFSFGENSANISCNWNIICVPNSKSYGIGCYVFCRLFTNNTTLTTADTSVALSYVRRYAPSVTASVTLRSALSSVATLIETATSGSTTSSSVWLNLQLWSVRWIACVFQLRCTKSEATDLVIMVSVRVWKTVDPIPFPIPRFR